MGMPEGYVPVADRIAQFRERYPDGTLRAADPSEPFRMIDVGDVVYLAYTAAAFRTPDDPAPGIGCAWERVPGLTNFTRNSELQNAESSAWGRAIIAVGAADAKTGIASEEDVRNRQAEDDYYASQPPPVPGFRSSLMAATEKLTDVERGVLREWLKVEGLPDRPSLMNAEQADRVCEFILHDLADQVPDPLMGAPDIATADSQTS